MLVPVNLGLSGHYLLQKGWLLVLKIVLETCMEHLLMSHSFTKAKALRKLSVITCWRLVGSGRGFFCVLLAELCRGYSRLYKAVQSSWNCPQRSLAHLLSAASAALVAVSRKAAVGQMGHGPCSAGSASGSVFCLVFQSLLC